MWISVNSVHNDQMWVSVNSVHNDQMWVSVNSVHNDQMWISVNSVHNDQMWISGSLRFSQFSGCWLILSVYIIMSFDFPFVRLVILLLPLFNSVLDNQKGILV
jgi:hypothetical protein